MVPRVPAEREVPAVGGEWPGPLPAAALRQGARLVAGEGVLHAAHVPAPESRSIETVSIYECGNVCAMLSRGVSRIARSLFLQACMAQMMCRASVTQCDPQQTVP